MQTYSPSTPEEAVFLMVSHLGRQLRKRQPGEELDIATWPLLYTLSCHGGLRLSDLAPRLQLDTSTVSRHVKQLEDRGLLERTEDPDDRRAALIRVTQSGQEALEAGRRRRREQIAKVLADWPEQDVEAFAAYATRFTEDLDRVLGGTEVER